MSAQGMCACFCSACLCVHSQLCMMVRATGHERTGHVRAFTSLAYVCAFKVHVCVCVHNAFVRALTMHVCASMAHVCVPLECMHACTHNACVVYRYVCAFLLHVYVRS
jgi:hypothetical protein